MAFTDPTDEDLDPADAYQRLSTMQSFVAEVLSEFVQLPHDKVDQGINWALARLGEFCRTDRTYVFSFRGDIAVNTHEWCADGVQPEIDNLQAVPLEPMSFWMDDFRAGRHIYLPDVPGLPEHRTDRDVLMEQGIMSLLAVPMLSGGALLGFVGFDAVHAYRTYLPGEISLLRSICDVITSAVVRREAHEQLTYQATHDPLTGLPNRMLLDDRLQQAASWSAQNGTSVGVLFFDLDRFKLINDGHGHGVGDALLTEVAHRLKHAIRAEDTVARFGGDEFVVVMPNVTDPEQIERLAARLQATLTDPVHVGPLSFYVTASVGGAVAPGKHLDTVLLLAQADTAMYEAKENGRNRVVGFNGTLSQRVARRTAIVHQLPRALDAGLITCHFQPLVQLSDERCIAVESLARWTDPELGVVHPDEFISVAEDIGMIRRLGDCILRYACEQAVNLPDGMYVSVNLSPAQLSDPRLGWMVASALSDAGCPAERLCLEVTESVLMCNTTQAVATLYKIRRTGVRIALDDFGTGYSSLAVLRTLPIDILKIDKKFVAGMCDHDLDTRLVTAVISLARDFSLATVAEGVETPEHADALRRLGCDIAQGWLYAKAMPMEQFHTWYQSRKTPTVHSVA